MKKLFRSEIECSKLMKYLLYLSSHHHSLCLSYHWDQMKQIFGLTIFNFAFLCYAIIQISEIKSAFNSLENNSLDQTSVILVSIIPGIISIAGIAYCYLSWHIYRLMGWEVFKKLGADRIMKVRCDRYRFDSTDFFKGLSVSLLVY